MLLFDGLQETNELHQQLNDKCHSEALFCETLNRFLPCEKRKSIIKSSQKRKSGKNEAHTESYSGSSTDISLATMEDQTSESQTPKSSRNLSITSGKEMNLEQSSTEKDNAAAASRDDTFEKYLEEYGLHDQSKN